MREVRRSAYIVLRCGDTLVLDVTRLLAGGLAFEQGTAIHALSLVSGDESALSAGELDLLLDVPVDRPIACADLSSQHDLALVTPLARRGLLITDEPDGELAQLRERDERLGAAGWHPYAALFHFVTRRRDGDASLPDEIALDAAGELARAGLAAIVAERGLPPPPFPPPRGKSAVELPLAERAGGLYDVLRARTTTRRFALDVAMPIEQLSIVLRYAFGPHGCSQLVPELVTLRKTSPSGGGLHPIEVYPLVVAVDGVEPGLYHYAARSHSFEPVALMRRGDAEDAALEAIRRQPPFTAPHALLVLVARFARSFWKYRNDPRAYAVVLMDAGHLSQTTYLVATDLGLGAFVTGAINSGNIDERLGLDGVEEAAVAVCGCGIALADARFDEGFRPYVPRETEL